MGPFLPCMTYADKLRDPRWQKLRLQVFERDEWSCQCCGEATQELNVHHLHYVRGKEPFEYDLPSLTTLCRRCHKNVTDAIDAIRNFFGSACPIQDTILFAENLKKATQEKGWPLNSVFQDFENDLRNLLEGGNYIPPSSSPGQSNPF
jgi:hypothetical protein